MNTQLIMLPEPILVSDEEIKEGDWYVCWETISDTPSNFLIDNSQLHSYCIGASNYKKIIAGIEGLPSIDFSGLSDEVCERIGWVDVNKLAFEKYGHHDNTVILSFKEGFKTAQSLNDKRFSLEEVKTLLYWASGMGAGKIHSGKSYTDIAEEVEAKIKSLPQPKVFDVEVEVNNTTNSIKIVNVKHEKL